MKAKLLILGCLGALTAGPGTASAEQPTVRIQSTDFSGRPPFTRRYEELPVSEVARLEPAAPAADGPTVSVRTTDFSGRPPFVRKREVLPMAEVARLEVEAEDGARPISRRAPFRSKVH